MILSETKKKKSNDKSSQSWDVMVTLVMKVLTPVVRVVAVRIAFEPKETGKRKYLKNLVLIFYWVSSLKQVLY